MIIDLTPEQEALIEQTMRDGHFGTPAEALSAALTDLHARQNQAHASRSRLGPVRSKNLADLLSEEPWAGADIDGIRDPSPGRDIDL